MLAVPGGQPGWGRHVQGRARYHGDDGGPPRNVGRLHPAADTTFNNLPKLGESKRRDFDRTDPESPSLFIQVADRLAITLTFVQLKKLERRSLRSVNSPTRTCNSQF
jgi:hypothetical protein